MELSFAQVSVWDDLLGAVSSRLSQQVFDTWFRPITFIESNPKARSISISATENTKDWVCRYYRAIIEEAMEEAGLSGYSLDWFVINDNDHTDEAEIYFETAPRNAPLPGVVNYANFESLEPSLNSKYTFDKFVVGSSNEFAHAAALSVSEAPGTAYNPLFIYGGVGLGKTHLMHAIGHSIQSRNPKARVAYVTSEKFTNDLINAIRYDKTSLFRDKYRSIDILLIDDVQFLAGKERTQEEFFHTFNTLHNDQKQIVVSSDCPPREIPTLQERLHSRFEWGLIADIEPPDLETKVAILKRKAEHDALELTDDVAMYIASKVRSNVRELEGSLVRLVAIASMKKEPLTRQLAREAMKNVLDAVHPAGLTIERIARAVASHFKMTVEEMKSKNNSRSVAVPRQVAMYLCKRLTRNSYPEIGRELGGKHHTTVMHSFEKINSMVASDPVFHNMIEELIDNICN
ncbi:MAG: chromosomal replication initiator protein DnaA [Chloracidobacterium sp.]|nr:chromosomal replication initiator protein DnaA [Chloracidobacterium sp.]MCO5332471.1 chromosomal replication initiator protein DnaA [Pyrinomonadaceae bacterium]